MKNIANYISISRILSSIILIATKTFSIPFYILYVYCGVSDIVDGFIARSTNTTSVIGSKLDSISDLIFVIISINKIFPRLNLNNVIIIWIIIILLIKIYTLLSSYFYYKKLIFLHTILNKITGFVLFIYPLIIHKNENIIFEIIICGLANFAAIQESYYVRKKRW